MGEVTGFPDKGYTHLSELANMIQRGGADGGSPSDRLSDWGLGDLDDMIGEQEVEAADEALLREIGSLKDTGGYDMLAAWEACCDGCGPVCHAVSTGYVASLADRDSAEAISRDLRAYALLTDRPLHDRSARVEITPDYAATLLNRMTTLGSRPRTVILDRISGGSVHFDGSDFHPSAERKTGELKPSRMRSPYADLADAPLPSANHRLPTPATREPKTKSW